MSRIGASLLLHGEVQTIDSVLTRIEAVTREDVLAVADELAQAPRTLSAVGPFDEDAFDNHLVSVSGR
jgi:predicted Zn-dependent peptidase